MTHSLHIILRCDQFTPDPQALGAKSLCKAYVISSRGQDIEQARATAVDKGWTFVPGKPFRHISARDYCPDHKPEDP